MRECFRKIARTAAASCVSGRDDCSFRLCFLLFLPPSFSSTLLFVAFEKNLQPIVDSGGCASRSFVWRTLTALHW